MRPQDPCSDHYEYSYFCPCMRLQPPLARPNFIQTTRHLFPNSPLASGYIP